MDQQSEMIKDRTLIVVKLEGQGDKKLKKLTRFKYMINVIF